MVAVFSSSGLKNNSSFFGISAVASILYMFSLDFSISRTGSEKVSSLAPVTISRLSDVIGLVDGVAKKLTNDFFEAFIKNHQLDQESSLKDDARKEEKKSANNKSYYIVIVTLIMLLFFYLGSS